MRGFMGITCQFIMNWSMKSLMLACRRFIGRHTAVNIAQYYHETVTSNKISSKIVTIITDNASNVIKAVSIPGFHDSTSHNEVDEDEEDEMKWRFVTLMILHFCGVQNMTPALRTLYSWC